MSVTPTEGLTLLAGDPLDALGERRSLHRLAQAFLRWMEAQNRPQTSMASSGDALGSFLTFAGRHGVRCPDDVTVLVCDAVYAWLRDTGRQPHTIAHRRSVLIAFSRWLEHDGFADRNIPATTSPITTPKRRPVSLEPHQIDGVLAKLSELPSLRGQRDHAMVATFFSSGARVSELAALKTDDVDLTAARIRINGGKGGKDRVLFLPPRLAPILRRSLAEVRPQRSPCSPWLFPHAATSGHRQGRGGQPLLTRTIYATIRQRARTRLGVTCSPHTLRHTCASSLLYHDATLETIQRILGHEDIRTTMIDLHRPQKAQEDEIRRIFG